MRERPQAWRTSFIQSVQPLVRVGYFESVLGVRVGEDGEELQAQTSGECGIPQTILALSKSFVGSGVTFLPGAFMQGGWLFSPIILLVIGICNGCCIRLLLKCSDATGLSGFGEIAERAAGRVAKQAVHVSLVISQFATNVAYLIFISQMATSLGALRWLTEPTTMLLVLLVIVPLCFIRNIHKMEYAILGADVFIVFGLGIAVYYCLSDIVAGRLDSSVPSFKPATCGVFLGTAVFTFEGIPFILPVRSSMREPEKFWPLFVKVFTCILIFFAAFGLMGYVDYGSQVKAVILLNLPQDSLLAASVRFAYMVALILGSPLVFLPAARITELWIFGVVSPKGSKRWSKNVLRTLEVCLFGVVALYGGAYFEKFLAFTGALCCAPIAFIYPAFFHLRLCARSCKEKVVDLLFIALGLAAMIFVTFESILI